MNERIKQLAIQAGFLYEDYKDIWYLEYHNQSCEEEMKKFAELIVRECMDICKQQRRKILQNPNDPSWTEHLAECETIMQQRFEVQ